MDFLDKLGIQPENAGVSTGSAWIASKGERIDSYSPVDGQKTGSVTTADQHTYNQVIDKAAAAFHEWRMWPAHKRGEVVRQGGEALRACKEPLGKLVSYERGKRLREGYGEVQEMSDIGDFALGVSRAVNETTKDTER